MSGNLRILCISPVFVPMANPEAFCGAKMVKALIDAGCEFQVLHWIDGAGSNMDRSGLWRPAIDVSRDVVPPRPGQSIWGLWCAARYRTTSYARWVAEMVATARLLHRETPFDIVYSRSLPIIAHIAGYWIARGIKRPWIANINDPWDLHMFPDIKTRRPSWSYRAVSAYWLRRTLRLANAITYPCDRLRDFHIHLTGISHTSTIVPHVGWSHPSEPRSQDYFHLLHAGRLVDRLSNRGASTLLAGLQRFLSLMPEARLRTKLILVGQTDTESRDLINEFGLQDVVVTTGRVSYEDSLRYIENASVCILVEGKIKEGIYLPSKFVDYVVARKPILAMSPATGVIADMLPSRGLLRVDPDDIDGIARAIGHLYEVYRDNNLENEVPPIEFVSQFIPQDVAAKFLSIVSGGLQNR